MPDDQITWFEVRYNQNPAAEEPFEVLCHEETEFGAEHRATEWRARPQGYHVWVAPMTATREHPIAAEAPPVAPEPIEMPPRLSFAEAMRLNPGAPAT